MKNEFAQREKNTIVWSLPESEFRLGGYLDGLARAAGYSSGKAFVNEGDLWSAPAAEVIQILEAELCGAERPMENAEPVGSGE